LQPTRPVRGKDMVALFRSPFQLVRRHYDLVHSLLYQSIYTEALFVKKLARAKYVYTKSNLSWENHPRQWHRKTLFADRVISISQATSDLLAQHGFSEKTEKIYLGIDTDHFVHDDNLRRGLRFDAEIPENAFVFGCAAQFVEWKEHLTVVKAFEHIADAFPDAYLVFCGPNHRDQYYRECVSYIEASPARERIRLLGSLKNMPSFYSTIDCFVLASRFETFGYVYVEAMSCSKPVIACRAAGPLEIVVEGETGLFTRMSDPSDLADRMRRYAGEPGQAREHGHKARERAIAVFSKQVMADRCQDLYTKLVAE
jgi:glycosyltransferase involved in cell wall biosynthesis